MLLKDRQASTAKIITFTWAEVTKEVVETESCTLFTAALSNEAASPGACRPLSSAIFSQMKENGLSRIKVTVFVGSEVCLPLLVPPFFSPMCVICFPVCVHEGVPDMLSCTGNNQAKPVWMS